MAGEIKILNRDFVNLQLWDKPGIPDKIPHLTHSRTLSQSEEHSRVSQAEHETATKEIQNEIPIKHDQDMKSSSKHRLENGLRKSKKKVSFLSDKDLVQVIEISPRSVSPLAEELEPCDLDKLIMGQDMEHFSYEQYCLQKFLGRNISSGTTDSRPLVGTSAVSQKVSHPRGEEFNRQHPISGRFFPNHTRQSSQTGSQKSSTSKKSQGHIMDVRSILGSQNEIASRHGSEPRMQKVYRDVNRNKNSSNSFGLRERRTLANSSAQGNGQNVGVYGNNIFMQNSRNSKKRIDLKINGESLSSGNNRIHSSPYRQSSANPGRPLGSLRMDSLSLTGSRMDGDKPRTAERRVQSASARLSPRKVYAWQVATNTSKGQSLDQQGPYISQLWNASPRTNTIRTESVYS